MGLETGGSQADLPDMGMTAGGYVCNGGVHLPSKQAPIGPSEAKKGWTAVG